MKVRAGFVSNSSSSSFILVGKCVSGDEVSESVGKDGYFWEITKDYTKTLIDSYEIDYSNECIYVGDIINSWCGGVESCTLDEMVSKLSKAREKHGGNAMVYFGEVSE